MNFCKIFKRIFLITALTVAATHAHAETEDQHIKVALRTIGHEFLLAPHVFCQLKKLTDAMP